MKRWGVVALGVALLGAVAFYGLTAPSHVDAQSYAGLEGDAARGARVFWAGGCASCHVEEGAAAADPARPVLGGGHVLDTPFGRFVGPNISPDPEHGIGGWTLTQFADAVQRGVAPDGRHYYPVFPYTSYARMTPQDVVDLKAFLDTLPRSARPSEPQQLAFPYSVRRGIGLWKRRYADAAPILPTNDPALERGRYLVEALGHCGECHTPRDRYGGLERTRWLAGAANPTGSGSVPGLTPATLDWSAGDIAYYLETGFDPTFDSAGGSMAEVVRNMGRLPAEDRAAIAAYIKAVPPAR